MNYLHLKYLICFRLFRYLPLSAMDSLSQLALRSQTVLGGLHFLLFLVSWPFVIGFLKDYHDKDRLTFNCVPKPSDFTRQRCYDNYTSAMSPLLTPLDFAGITYGALGFFWAFFILTGAMVLRRIQRERNEQRKRHQSIKFLRRFVCHVFFQLAVLGGMMGLFCAYQSFRFPAEYKCSRTNTTLTTFNKVAVNITCNDLRYKEKTKLNIAIIVIMAISIALCLLTVIHLAVTRKAFLAQLLGDIFEKEDDNAAGINLEGKYIIW